VCDRIGGETLFIAEGSKPAASKNKYLWRLAMTPLNFSASIAEPGIKEAADVHPI